jgi:hypothetical protein
MDVCIALALVLVVIFSTIQGSRSRPSMICRTTSFIWRTERGAMDELSIIALRVIPSHEKTKKEKQSACIEFFKGMILSSVKANKTDAGRNGDSRLGAAQSLERVHFLYEARNR